MMRTDATYFLVIAALSRRGAIQEIDVYVKIK